MTYEDIERRPRILALDVVRGFALCGILLANVRPIANISGMIIHGGQAAVPAVLGVLVEQRFYPIFATLFGVGFALLLRAAGDRVARPRLVLLRRLLTLLAVGLVHMFALWRGDVLTIYATVGLLVLLPSSWLPRKALPVLAVLFAVAAVAVYGGGYALTPALFLFGSALVRYGVIDRIGRIPWWPAVVFGVLAAAGAAVQLTPGLRDRTFGMILGVDGLLVAGLYVCTLCRLLRTCLRPVLQAVFAPLGRMALTNYLSATVIVLTLAHLHGHPQDWSWGTVYAITGTILVVQCVWSTLWLRRHRQGPLEWLWRWATWARRPPLRIAATAGSGHR